MGQEDMRQAWRNKIPLQNLNRKSKKEGTCDRSRLEDNIKMKINCTDINSMKLA
jgi:hypothetical protein